MTEIIRFHIIPPSEIEAASEVHRSNKMLYISVLMGLLVIALAIETYSYLEQKQKGTVKEQAPNVNVSQKPPAVQASAPASDTTTTDTAAAVKDTSVAPATHPPTTIKTVSGAIAVIAAHRQSWGQLLTALINNNVIECSEIISADENSALLRGNIRTDKELNKLIQRMQFTGGVDGVEKFSVENTKDGINFIIKAKLHKQDVSSATADSLISVKPFLRGQAMRFCDSLATASGLKVADNFPIGSKDYNWGSRFDFVLKVRGNASELSAFLERLGKDKRIMSVFTLGAQFSSGTSFAKKRVDATIVIALYNVSSTV